MRDKRGRTTMQTMQMIGDMASIREPFGLFEPYIWRDKIGDGLWHCEIRSVDTKFASETGQTFDEAVTACYIKFLMLDLPPKKDPLK